jgi:hypothetical protein
MAQTFERTQELLSAISDLSVHSKLVLKGIDDRARSAEIQKAKGTIVGFLERLGSMIAQAQHTRSGVMVGADPELGLLAQRFRAPRASNTPGSSGGFESLQELRDLLDAGDAVDHKRLIAELRELRKIVEEHAQSDITAVLGDA